MRQDTPTRFFFSSFLYNVTALVGHDKHNAAGSLTVIMTLSLVSAMKPFLCASKGEFKIEGWARKRKVVTEQKNLDGPPISSEGGI